MMKNSEESLANTSRDSLKLVGVMGEVLNKDAWYWYFNSVGKGKCPVINMWGQTELGGVPTAPLCNLDEMKTYGHAGRPFFGCKILSKDGKGNNITNPEQVGDMFLKHSLPGMLLGIWGEKTAMHKLYYSQATDGSYCAGDEVYFDHDQNIWITGRNDDVLNVSGHRVSPIEIEEVIASTGITAEVSVVGYPHEIKGEGIFAFIVLKKELAEEQRINAKKTISDHVKNIISPITKPDVIHIVDDLPKTISGKILRRILRKIASGDTQDFADLSTLANHECLEKLSKSDFVA
jgi:acetyl-CoA synthetase